MKPATFFPGHKRTLSDLRSADWRLMFFVRFVPWRLTRRRGASGESEHPQNITESRWVNRSMTLVPETSKRLGRLAMLPAQE